jgi:hypothetical protein
MYHTWQGLPKVIVKIEAIVLQIAMIFINSTEWQTIGGSQS